MTKLSDGHPINDNRDEPTPADAVPDPQKVRELLKVCLMRSGLRAIENIGESLAVIPRDDESLVDFSYRIADALLGRAAPTPDGLLALADALERGDERFKLGANRHLATAVEVREFAQEFARRAAPVVGVFADLNSECSRCGDDACRGAKLKPICTRCFAAPVAGTPEVNIGLHVRVEINYEVDQYRAQLIHENEQVLVEAVGFSPSLALAALSVEARNA